MKKLILLLLFIPLVSFGQEIKNPFNLSMEKIYDSPTNYIWEWMTEQDCNYCPVKFIKKGSWKDFVRFSSGKDSGTYTKEYPYTNYAGSAFKTYKWEIGYLTKEQQKRIHKDHGKKIFKSKKVLKLYSYFFYTEKVFYLDYETYIENGINYAYVIIPEYNNFKRLFLHKLKRVTITENDKIELNSNFNFLKLKQNHISNQLTSWEKKGEFEKISEYNIRVNDNTRLQKTQTLSENFDNQIKDYYWKLIKHFNFKLLPYNADEEFFLVQGKGNNIYKFNIPIDVAKTFKNRMNNCNSFDAYSYYKDVVLYDPVIEFLNNKFVLTGVNFRWARNGPEPNKRHTN